METYLGGVDACSLSLRENCLEMDIQPILSVASTMAHLTKLDLSGANFAILRRSTKHVNTLTNILLEIVKLIGEDDSVIFSHIFLYFGDDFSKFFD